MSRTRQQKREQKKKRPLKVRSQVPFPPSQAFTDKSKYRRKDKYPGTREANEGTQGGV